MTNYFIAVYDDNNDQAPDFIKESYDYKIYNTIDNNGNKFDNKLLSNYLTEFISSDNDANIIIVGSDTDTVIYTHEILKNVANTICLTNNKIGDLDCITIKKIKQLGINNIIPLISNNIDTKLHLVIDVSICDSSYAPCTNKLENDISLTYDELLEIIELLKHKVSYFNIIGFNAYKDLLNDNNVYKCTKMTGDICRDIICRLFDIKNKKINLFTEDTKFLIYRPIVQDYGDDESIDVGWYILRHMTLNEREQLIKTIDDNIITTEYDNGDDIIDVYITVTTIREQNEKSYYTTSSVYDCCLFPREKSLMIFELLNAQTDSRYGNILHDQ